MLLQLPAPAWAQPIEQKLPNLFLQEDAFAQEPRGVQLGARAAWQPYEGGRSMSLGPNLEVGLDEGLTLLAEWSLSFIDPDVGDGVQGLGNPRAGLLLEIVPPGGVLGLSGLVMTTLPSPSDAGFDAFSHEAALLMHVDLSLVHVQLQGGLEVSHGSDVADDPDVSFEHAAAVYLDLGLLLPAVEYAREAEFGEDRDTLAAGLIVAPLESFQFGAAATLELSTDPARAGALGLVSFTF